MQTFIDSATQRVWAFDDDVVVTEKNGIFGFASVNGQRLTTPDTLQPYIVSEPTAAQLATQAWAERQSAAMQALIRSDNTMARAVEAVALGHNTYTSADMVAYVAWRRLLRAIIGAPSGDPTEPLPVEPPYPAGT